MPLKAVGLYFGAVAELVFLVDVGTKDAGGMTKLLQPCRAVTSAMEALRGDETFMADN